jgi:hypothetical protein
MENNKRTHLSRVANGKSLPIIALVIGASSLLFLFAGSSVVNPGTPFVTSVTAADDSPATVADRTRTTDPATGFAAINDFERIIYVSSTQSVTTIGKNNNVQRRAFLSATVYYEPAMPVQDVIRYVGGDVNAAYDLVAMRCRPPDRSKTQAVLATWPNVFKALVADLGSTYSPTACPPKTGDVVDKQVYCAALAFIDQPNTQVPLVLQAMMNAGVALLRLQGGAFQPTGSTVGADVLYDLYGIGYGFSGLGYSVKDSYLSGHNVSLTSAQILTQSVVPEYLLMNVTLAEGGCSCIRVKPYASRDQGFIDWNRVFEVGSKDSCTVLTHLP